MEATAMSRDTNRQNTGQQRPPESGGMQRHGVLTQWMQGLQMRHTSSAREACSGRSDGLFLEKCLQDYLLEIKLERLNLEFIPLTRLHEFSSPRLSCAKGRKGKRRPFWPVYVREKDTRLRAYDL